MSAIIPSPEIKTAFNTFPIPKYLKITKRVMHVETINPRLELANINEDTKKRNVNKFTKKIKINIDDFGSVK
jgi:hypothetical protein